MIRGIHFFSSFFVVASKDKENQASQANIHTIEDEIAASVSNQFGQEKSEKAAELEEDILKVLGEDPSASKEVLIQLHPEIKPRWKKWMSEGLSQEQRNLLLNKYSRSGDLYTEFPKINLEIVPAMSEIAAKRDQHFVDTQKCVGSAIIVLGAALSMLLENPEEGIDELSLLNYLCDTGKLLTDVFYQQSTARKSFITPLLDKAVKPVLEATKSDQWLYGEKFAEQIKEAKSVERACKSIKGDAIKKPIAKAQTRNQGNWRAPPARTRQVGGIQRRSTIRFKPSNQSKMYQSGYQSLIRTPNQKPYYKK